MPNELEHVNMTVSDAEATAKVLQQLFDWHIRWQGPTMDGGHTVHIGTDKSYVALYSPVGDDALETAQSGRAGALNHIGVTVPDLDQTRARVEAAGYQPGETYDYEPGHRFYFHEENGVEIEVISYA